MFSSRSSLLSRATQVALKRDLPISNFRLAVSPGQKQPQQHRCRSTMRAPSVRRREREAGSNPTSDSLFNQSDVPILNFWQDYATSRISEGPTAEVLLNTALQYCTVAVRNNSTWKGALQRDHNIDCYTLHHAAIPLILRPSGNSFILGMHMLMTASTLKYSPSTLSLIRMLAGYEGERFARNKAQFRDAITNFQNLLRTERTPDALTLQGLLLVREGRDLDALRCFNQAIQASAKENGSASDKDQPTTIPAIRKPKWTYEPTLHQNRGLILLRQGRTEEATASFKIAALELDMPEAYLSLAKLLPQRAPEKETYLLKAAQAGSFEACELLALGLLDKIAEPEIAEEDRVFAARMAGEWALLLPEEEKREKLKALLAERLEA